MGGCQNPTAAPSFVGDVNESFGLIRVVKDSSLDVGRGRTTDLNGTGRRVRMTAFT